LPDASAGVTFCPPTTLLVAGANDKSIARARAAAPGLSAGGIAAFFQESRPID